MTLLGWIPGESLQDVEQPRLMHNASRQFERRWSTVNWLHISCALQARHLQPGRMQWVPADGAAGMDPRGLPAVIGSAALCAQRLWTI